MKKFVLKALMIVVMLTVSVTSFAIPAKKTQITIKQPTGKNLTLIPCGDERMSWAVTLDGYTLLGDNQGFFTYAVKDSKGNMVASNVYASNEQERDDKEVKFVASLEKNIHFSKQQADGYNFIWNERMGEKNKSTMNKAYPTVGSDSLLLILVEFQDVHLTYSKQDFENLVGQNNYNGTGSVKDYYLTNSGGRYEMNIRVAGPYRLSKNMEYYGKDTVYNYQGNSYTQHDMRATEMIKEAIRLADPDVDFSHFDSDGNYIIDGINVVYAGVPQASFPNLPNTIWPHSGNVDNNLRCDGYRFSRYATMAEKRSQYAMDGIGTICHEFGHVLGLPDHYDTDYAESGGNSVTTEDWDLMGSGCYNNNSASPALLSAGERACLKWIKIDTLTAPRDSVMVPVLKGSNDSAFLIPLDNAGREFLVLEYRKKQGFDSYIPGEGMLIYHGNWSKINAWITRHENTININPSDRGWYIEPSNGQLYSINSQFAPFAGTSNICYFNSTSPNRLHHCNSATDYIEGINITNIGYVNDSTMVFSYNSVMPYVRTNTIATNTVTTGSFTVTGEVLYEGQGNYASKGIIYSTDPDFEANLDNAVYDESDSETSISVNLTGLDAGVRYYVRAFMKTDAGIVGYGDLVSATTRDGLGLVMTNAASNTDSTSLTLNGNLYHTGEGEYIEKGFVYTTAFDVLPTIENGTKVLASDQSSAAGQFSADLTDLDSGVVYFYRAFVTNSFGTYYASKVAARTLFRTINGNTVSSNQQICQGTIAQDLTGAEPTGGYGQWTYLWQQRNYMGSWEDADGINDQQNYSFTQALQDSTYFRRLAISKGNVYDTSNQVLIDIRISRGGSINAVSTAAIHSNGTLTSVDRRGNIVDWEKSTDNRTTWTSMNMTSPSVTELFENAGYNYYRVKVQIDNCPVAYSDVKEIYVDNSSISDAENTFNITVAPNPAKDGVFTLTSDLKNASVIVTNALGQIVYSENNTDITHKTINLNSQPTGTYFIRMLADGKIFTKKIIINK